MSMANDLRPRPRTSVSSAPLSADLRLAVLRLARRIRSEKNSEDMTDSQFSVLCALRGGRTLTLGELSAHEGVQPPSMTRTVNGLCEAGLVERGVDPGDGRRTLIALTARGDHEVVETRRRRDAWLSRRLAALDREDRQLLARASQILRELAAS